MSEKQKNILDDAIEANLKELRHLPVDEKDKSEKKILLPIFFSVVIVLGMVIPLLIRLFK